MAFSVAALEGVEGELFGTLISERFAAYETTRRGFLRSGPGIYKLACHRRSDGGSTCPQVGESRHRDQRHPQSNADGIKEIPVTSKLPGFPD